MLAGMVVVKGLSPRFYADFLPVKLVSISNQKKGNAEMETSYVVSIGKKKLYRKQYDPDSPKEVIVEDVVLPESAILAIFDVISKI